MDHDRRRFLTNAATAMAGAYLVVSKPVDARQRVPRELAALERATEWLNSSRLRPQDFSGKVVLVNFGTYTCINWLRTLPYIRAWAQKYHERLAFIGVHTPEFEFERNIDNVRRAVRQMRIEYPVVIDNDYSIWRAFENQYWPALYLVDARGRIRYRHFGEGEYKQSEEAIQRLLGESTGITFSPAAAFIEGAGLEVAADWGNLKSPENYTGYDRTENFSSRGGPEFNRRHLYTAPARLSLNQWALTGEWTMGRQATVATGPLCRIVYRFHARDLHLVMKPPPDGSSVPFRVSIDGQPPGPARGLDVDEAGKGNVVEPRLYQLIRQSKPIIDRQFEIEFLKAGVEVFAFTFG